MGRRPWPRAGAAHQHCGGGCRYLNTIQTTSQHLLRYLAAAVVVNKRRRNVVKDLIKVIQQEVYEYSDPITQFLQCLFVDYDFEGAQQKLKECEEVGTANRRVFHRRCPRFNAGHCPHQK